MIDHDPSKSVRSQDAVSDILVSVGKSVLSAVGDESREQGEALEPPHPIREELATESFVRGSFISSEAVVPTSYTSQVVEQALQAAGLRREDLLDLSRLAEVDGKIEQLSWAQDFTRARLTELSDSSHRRSPLSGDTAPFDAPAWLTRVLQENFQRTVRSKNSFLVPLNATEAFQVQAIVTVGEGVFPVLLKPYICVSTYLSPVEVLQAASMRSSSLHPLWFLSLKLGRLVVSRNHEQLAESLDTFIACLKAIMRVRLLGRAPL